jgi:hypothetical protein
MGWSFEGAPPERIPFGEWVFEVWAGRSSAGALRSSGRKKPGA